MKSIIDHAIESIKTTNNQLEKKMILAAFDFGATLSEKLKLDVQALTIPQGQLASDYVFDQLKIIKQEQLTFDDEILKDITVRSEMARVFDTDSLIKSLKLNEQLNYAYSKSDLIMGLIVRFLNLENLQDLLVHVQQAMNWANESNQKLIGFKPYLMRIPMSFCCI